MQSSSLPKHQHAAPACFMKTRPPWGNHMKIESIEFFRLKETMVYFAQSIKHKTSKRVFFFSGKTFLTPSFKLLWNGHYLNDHVKSDGSAKKDNSSYGIFFFKFFVNANQVKVTVPSKLEKRETESASMWEERKQSRSWDHCKERERVSCMPVCWQI